MTDRRGVRLGVLLAGLSLALAASPLAALPLTDTGRRAYDTARSADDGATAAFEEGEKTLALVKALAPDRDVVPPALKPFLEEGDAAHQALTSYRRLAQTGSTDALQLLADVTRLPSGASPDVVRRDTLEQHALLAAREASVMAARARAEAERLRAILAEARLALAEGKGAPAPRGARGAAPARAAGQGPPADETRAGDTVVPNLIGGRLDAAVRELAAAGLRLGAVTGPRDGYVVKQSPDGGAPAPRQSAVAVTLSATAATIVPSP